MTPTGFGCFDVTVRLGGVMALDRVTLAAEPGRLTAVVGGDGAGKTTVLRTLVGRVRPAAGDVYAPPRERIGFMPATAGSWDDLTVAENMAFAGTAYGLDRARLAERTAHLLGRAGLTDATGRLARQLSGGMRTKLGFCLAMLHEPDLLVLDEPSTGVDPVSRVELWRLLSETAAAGTTVALSTTYMDEAERAAAVVVLERGRVLLSGSPDEVVSSSPGVVVQLARGADVRRPAYAWRHGASFREWWPEAPPAGTGLVTPGLEDVTIVASLRAAAGAAADASGAPGAGIGSQP